MTTDSKIIRAMLIRISEFFCYMSDSEEQRLYYVLPIQHNFPYAYQHSSIRDVATTCDILDLVQFFKEKELPLPPDSLILFEKVTRNTLHAYYNLYQGAELPNLPEGNIGDIGFFLLALQKCFSVYPSQLPDNWKETKIRLTKYLLERQNSDGSLRIFFDDTLKYDEKSAEAFYLPEALIGLITSLGSNTKEIDDQVVTQVQKAIIYCCQDKNRKWHLATESATFYANWQFQLFYRWVQKDLGDEKIHFSVTNHLEKLVNALKESRMAREPFGHAVATVEVACYLEGLVHAKYTLEKLYASTRIHDEWFDKEINRALLFLYELQSANLNTIHGGFVHSLGSHEARIDVAGHVFSGLSLLYSYFK